MVSSKEATRIAMQSEFETGAEQRQAIAQRNQGLILLPRYPDDLVKNDGSDGHAHSPRYLCLISIIPWLRIPANCGGIVRFRGLSGNEGRVKSRHQSAIKSIAEGSCSPLKTPAGRIEDIICITIGKKYRTKYPVPRPERRLSPRRAATAHGTSYPPSTTQRKARQEAQR